MQPIPAWARSARGAALHVLMGMATADHDARERLDRILTQLALDPRDSGLCTELVYGIVKRRRTLDTVLRTMVTRPWHRVEANVRQLLRVGAYQVLFLDRVPVSAATHATVELAKAVGRGGAAAFCNAVLRRLAQQAGAVVSTGGDTRTIPMDRVDDIVFLATSSYLSRPVREYWEGKFGQSLVWYLAPFAQIEEWLLRFAEVRDAAEAEQKQN